MRCNSILGLSVKVVLPLAALAFAGGCQTMNSELAMLFGDMPPNQVAQAAEPAEASPTDTPKFYVELRESGKKPELIKLPLTQVVYIQQALDQSGATKQFRRMKVELYRQLPGGSGHMLPVEYNHNERRVAPGKDYAIHANDRLVITEDTSTVLDDMLGSLGVPVSK